MDRRDDLAEFLRSRRRALSPAEVGFPAGTRRRTPGLRREEVALLAGVSVTWYTWLEQGRPINVSRDVLDTLARTLRLSEAEHEHLITLADAYHAHPTTGDHSWSGGAPSALIRLVEALEPAPAFVLGPAWQLLAWNPAQARLAPQIERATDEERNLLWFVFAEPSIREMIVDWEDEARRMLAEFRSDTADHRDDPVYLALVKRLHEASEHFATWWAEYGVAAFQTRLRRFRHPLAGELTFEHQRFTPAEWPQLRVVCHLPLPGDDAAQRLAAWHRVV